ncbi:hypothetical protein OEZ85_013137 [Tetradesmus obliquus]|uniref:Vacuolar protein sorting-associated protein 13 VPS13 adaptor binding domain-containing protein n=1 Tax=Tetradesmus obliquus TaxID=3088 RepID=A0ABY8U5B2_TETOB|nr:hypothetical protein OEZ85_013137 [Tetradesmus obliquus]
MEATPPRRFDEIHAETDVCFDFLPQTAKFGKGWVVACSSDPLPLLQTPKMRAPGGCLETVAYQQSATASRPKLSLALAVEDERFRAWYEGLEEHVIRLVEQRCHKWFGKHANEVQPSVRDAFFSCMRPDDMRPQHVLTFSVPTRGDAVLVNFFAADGSTIPHTSVLKHHEVACHIELEGLWFANLRWGLRWRLTDVKTYGAGSTGAPSDFAFSMTKSNTSLVMVDNLPFTRAHGSAAFVFRHVLQEPLKRVRKVQLVSMTMDYRLFAVNVAIDELGGTEFPVFVDKSFDAPLLLAPHVAYEHRFRGEPLGVLGCLTIAIRGYDGSELEQQSPQQSRVTMLFSVEHDCVDGADALDDSDMRRTWLMLSNKHTSDHQPYVFKWPGPSHGPIHNVKRVALKALVMSTHATEQPYVRLTIPELQISEWPVPYTCDIIGTYYPYVVMHCSADYQVDYWPPKCRLGSLTVDIAQGNGLPLAWEQVEDRLVFMLLEVDYQPSPGHLPAPRPLTSRLLFVDNYRAQQPFKFRFELDEPCRAVQQLQLHQLACPHVEAAAAVAFVRLSIHNLSISWIVPYATWFYKPQPNVPAANPALHSATFSQPAAFTHMDVELEWLDPATGRFRAFQALPEACQTMCFAMRAMLWTRQ